MVGSSKLGWSEGTVWCGFLGLGGISRCGLRSAEARSGMDSLSAQDKATFQRATQRRKENGIRLKRFTVQAEQSQVEALNILLDAWVERYGKTLALDHLIVLWSRAEARVRDQENEPDNSARS